MHAPPSILLALFALSFLLASRIPRASRAPLYSIIALGIFSGIVRGIFPGDGSVFDITTVPGSALYAVRLLCVYSYSRIFYATTKVSEIGDWLTVVVRVTRSTWQRITGKMRADRHADHQGQSSSSILADPGMLLMLVLLFLPRIFDTYQRIREAGEIRGNAISGKNLFRAYSMLELLIIESMDRAWQTSIAMRVRGYSPERSLRITPLVARDYAVLVASFAMFFVR
jgi:energy-coupling factor transporter transmembrane protein EcfT